MRKQFTHTQCVCVWVVGWGGGCVRACVRVRARACVCVREIKATKTPSANNQNGFSSIINRIKNVKNVEEN